MNIYLVGGAVRDMLLSRPVADRDYLVTDADECDMVTMGFEKVGREKNVFLHPDTQDEYTLATEIDLREVKGKSLLEQDLWGRDFTVNAMAQDNMGRIIDLYGGKEDLKNKVLRHIDPLSFILSPIRVLRGARLAAKLEFSIFPETLQLMKRMVSLGYLDNIHPNRLWKEISRGLESNNPDVFWDILNQVGFWERFTPAVGLAEKEDKVLEFLHKTKHLDLDSRYAAMIIGMDITIPIHQRYAELLGVPRKTIEFTNNLMRKHFFDFPTARCAWDVIKNTDAIRKPERFNKLLIVSDAIYYPEAESQYLWMELLNAVRNIDLTDILKNVEKGKEREFVEAYRKSVIRQKCYDLNLK